MNPTPTEFTPEALDAITKQNTALAAWWAVARDQLSQQALTNLAQGLASGELRFVVTVQVNAEGTHMMASVMTAATGRVDQFFEIFLGGEPEDESSNEASTSPALH